MTDPVPALLPDYLSMDPIHLAGIDGPPAGFGYAYIDALTEGSIRTEAFDTGVDDRDGKQCVVCGDRLYEHVHIVPKTEEDTVRCGSYVLCPNFHHQMHSGSIFVTLN